jgi:hypothetical protein
VPEPGKDAEFERILSRVDANGAIPRSTIMPSFHTFIVIFKVMFHFHYAYAHQSTININI